MTAKQYLMQLRWLDGRIEVMQRELDELKTDPYNMTSEIKEVSVVSSHSPDPMADKITAIIDLQNRINDEIDALIDLRGVIRQQIGSLENYDYITLLDLRYVSIDPATGRRGYSWKAIAEALHYSEAHVRGYLHRESLVAFAQKFSKNL